MNWPAEPAASATVEVNQFIEDKTGSESRNAVEKLQIKKDGDRMQITSVEIVPNENADIETNP